MPTNIYKVQVEADGGLTWITCLTTYRYEEAVWFKEEQEKKYYPHKYRIISEKIAE